MSEVIKKDQQPIKEDELSRGIDRDYQQQTDNQSSHIKQQFTQPSKEEADDRSKKSGNIYIFNITKDKNEQEANKLIEAAAEGREEQHRDLISSEFTKKEYGGIIRQEPIQTNNLDHMTRSISKDISNPIEIGDQINSLRKSELGQAITLEELQAGNRQIIGQQYHENEYITPITTQDILHAPITRSIQPYLDHDYVYPKSQTRMINVPINEDIRFSNIEPRNEVIGSQSFSLTPTSQYIPFAKSIYVPQGRESYNQNMYNKPIQNTDITQPVKPIEQQNIIPDLLREQSSPLTEQYKTSEKLQAPLITVTGQRVEQAKTLNTDIDYIRKQPLLEKTIPYVNENLSRTIQPVIQPELSKTFDQRKVQIPFSNQIQPSIYNLSQQNREFIQPVVPAQIKEQAVSEKLDRNRIQTEEPLSRMISNITQPQQTRPMDTYRRSSTVPYYTSSLGSKQRPEGYYSQSFTQQTQPMMRIEDELQYQKALSRNMTYSPNLEQESNISPTQQYEERILSRVIPIKPVPFNLFDNKLLTVEKNIMQSTITNERIGNPPSFHYGVEGCKICGGYGFIKNKKNVDKMDPCLLCVRETGYCPRCKNTGYFNNDIKNKCPCRKVR
jgi:hypothetical protein